MDDGYVFHNCTRSSFVMDTLVRPAAFTPPRQVRILVTARTVRRLRTTQMCVHHRRFLLYLSIPQDTMAGSPGHPAGASIHIWGRHRRRRSPASSPACHRRKIYTRGSSFLTSAVGTPACRSCLHPRPCRSPSFPPSDTSAAFDPRAAVATPTPTTLAPDAAILDPSANTPLAHNHRRIPLPDRSPYNSL